METKEMTKKEVVEDCIQRLGYIELPVVQWQALITIRNVIANLGLVVKALEMEEEKEVRENETADS